MKEQTNIDMEITNVMLHPNFKQNTSQRFIHLMELFSGHHPNGYDSIMIV